MSTLKDNLIELLTQLKENAYAQRSVDPAYENIINELNQAISKLQSSHIHIPEQGNARSTVYDFIVFDVFGEDPKMFNKNNMKHLEKFLEKQEAKPLVRPLPKSR